MGRPPLPGMKPTTIRLPLETLQRIEALVGSRQIAGFIRDAVDRELHRREASTDVTEEEHRLILFIREAVESELKRRAATADEGEENGRS